MNRFRMSLVLGCLAIAGCRREEDPSSRFAVEFSAVNDEEAPLAGTRFLLGAKELWRSGPEGRAVLQLRGQEGQELPLLVECPEGHRPDGPAGKLRLTRVRSLGTDAARPLSVRARCERATKDVLLVVRAPQGQGASILVPGRPAEALDQGGFAHLLLTLPRDEKAVAVTFDTTGAPRLAPKNPERNLELPPGDGILLLSQDFSVRKTPVPRKKTSGPTRPVPYRVQ